MILITPQVWTIRRGRHLQTYGDHYEHTAIVTRVGDTVYVEAWSGDGPTREEVAAMRAYMRGQGLTYAAWERRRDGQVRFAKVAL